MRRVKKEERKYSLLCALINAFVQSNKWKVRNVQNVMAQDSDMTNND